jgi:hypothetical protein
VRRSSAVAGEVIDVNAVDPNSVLADRVVLARQLAVCVEHGTEVHRTHERQSRAELGLGAVFIDWLACDEPAKR